MYSSSTVAKDTAPITVARPHARLPLQEPDLWDKETGILHYDEHHSNWDKSNGTLLPLPARYFFGPPRKSRGFGSWLSSWKRHRLSSTLNEVPIGLLDPGEVVFDLAGPFDRV